MHTQKHLVEDIREKGVTRNYNTKTNEKLHGPIKDSYHLRSNFKNVASQILKADHICFVSLLIRQYLNIYDDYYKEISESHLEEVPTTTSNKPSFPPTQHHTLGSPQRPMSLSELATEKSSDIAFKDFSKKLTTFLNGFIPIYGINLPENIQMPLKLSLGEKVLVFYV